MHKVILTTVNGTSQLARLAHHECMSLVWNHSFSHGSWVSNIANSLCWCKLVPMQTPSSGCKQQSHVYKFSFTTVITSCHCFVVSCTYVQLCWAEWSWVVANLSRGWSLTMGCKGADDWRRGVVWWWQWAQCSTTHFLLNGGLGCQVWRVGSL